MVSPPAVYSISTGMAAPLGNSPSTVASTRTVSSTRVVVMGASVPFTVS
jgi:hypothetical protein